MGIVLIYSFSRANKPNSIIGVSAFMNFFKNWFISRVLEVVI